MKQDFEHLMQPYRPPAALARPEERPRFSLPELWDRAKAMFARMLEAAGGAERVRERQRFARKERREILLWLEPVERVTRAVLLARAVTRLLMTPQGRKLMRETPKQAPWQEAVRQAGPNSVRTTRIPHPGWHTIARAPVRPPPPPPAPPPPAPVRARACSFRVLRCTPPETAARLGPSRRPGIIDLFAEPPPNALRAPPRRDNGKPSPAGDRPDSLARRIEALSRALEKPEPIVRRLARFIASLPGGLLQPSVADATSGLYWRQGFPEFRDVRGHVAAAVNALGRPIEPG